MERPFQHTVIAFPATRKANEHRTWGKIPGEHRGQAAPGPGVRSSLASRFLLKLLQVPEEEFVIALGRRREPNTSPSLWCFPVAGGRAETRLWSLVQTRPPASMSAAPLPRGPRGPGVWRAWGWTHGAARRGIPRPAPVSASAPGQGSSRASESLPELGLGRLQRPAVPGSERTSLAAAMSMNFFSAFFFSSSFWKLSGCHCRANFRYALMISCFLAFLSSIKINAH